MMLAAVMTAAAIPAAQASEALSLGEAIRQALTSHPELALNRIDSDIATTETQRIEGLLDPVVTAGIGASDDKSPVASSFQASRTVSGQLNAGISKPLANGDTIGASLAYNRARQSYSNPVAQQFALVNPAYRGQIDINYRHPLLRGSDRPDYGQALQAAEDDVKASQLRRRTIARTLALQITNAYYQFASDHIQLQLARQAVARAERLLKYQAFRERFGLIEASDRLQATALLEARRLDLAQTEAQLATDRSTLNRLLLASPERPIEPVMPGDIAREVPADYEQLVEAADRKRPEFAILDAQLAAAEARLQQAMDADRSQLDLVAQLGTRSLDKRAAAAAGQAFGINNHYAELSFEYSDSVGSNAARAGIRKAELSRSRIVEQRRQTMETVRDDIARSWTSLKSGIPAYRQARRQVEAEKNKLEAELKRYREGRSDTATVVQFEGDLSNAERQAELLGVSLNLVEKQLSWAEGTLLDNLGIRPELAGAAQ